MFYNIEDFSVVDYVGGIKDLEIGQLRLIGDPAKRYIEDPVRILRAIRFASKLGLKIHPDTEEPIKKYANLLENIPAGRLYEEIIKLFLNKTLFSAHLLKVSGPTLVSTPPPATL